MMSWSFAFSPNSSTIDFLNSYRSFGFRSVQYQYMVNEYGLSDVERVDALIKAVRRADADRNGELSPAELSTLTPADQLTWKARQSLFG